MGMSQPKHRDLDRFQYWQGQMLRSRDFRDIEAVDAQRRWWHNRALHNAYGVWRGFKTELATRPSGRVLLVGPGVAYDLFGRELVLGARQAVPLPPNPLGNEPTTFSLIVRYSQQPYRSRTDKAENVCFTKPGGSRTGTVELVWKPSNLVRPDGGVLIANLTYEADPRLLPLAPIVPRALSMPILGSGTTVAGNTPWEPWTVYSGIYRTVEYLQVEYVIGVQTIVDTSSAGFSDVPVYFAWIEGSLWNPDTLQFAPAIFSSLADESSESFTFRLWLAVPKDSGLLRPTAGVGSVAASGPALKLVTIPDEFISFAQRQNLSVAWVGCQACRTGADAAAVQGNSTVAPIRVSPSN
jgi:hypothetical protein